MDGQTYVKSLAGQIPVFKMMHERVKKIKQTKFPGSQYLIFSSCNISPVWCVTEVHGKGLFEEK